MKPKKFEPVLICYNRLKLDDDVTKTALDYMRKIEWE